MSTQGWIGVDLDRTLAHYDEWRGETHIGEPIGPMVARVKQWLAEGRDVRIFTARLGNEPERGRNVRLVVEAIGAWCEQHLGVRLPVTNTKDYGMLELWDDRAVQVVPNTGIRADGLP